MKRILLITIAIIGMMTIDAQEVVLLRFAPIEKSVAKSNSDIANPRKSASSKTWINRGEIMQEAYRIDLEQIYDGMLPVELKLYYKEPIAISDETFNGKTYQVYEYERMHYYFLNNKLSLWKRIKAAFDNPLEEAYKSYMKAIELDQTDKVQVSIKKQLTDLKNQFKQLGINYYYWGDKEQALTSFSHVLDIDKLAVFLNAKDTLMIQYSGIISRETGDYKKAIEYYKEFNELKKLPDNYLLIKEDYLKMKDTASALQVLEEGFSVFPDSTNVLANLIDLCIKSNDYKKGLSIVNAAIEKNPNNGYYHYWKGRLLLKSDDENRIDDALEAYQNAIDADPSLSYAYFDKGFIYFLLGQEFFTRAGESKDISTRDILNKEGNDNYEKAIPLLEKASELSMRDISILKEVYETLKRIYYKMQMTEKYNAISEKLNTM